MPPKTRRANNGPTAAGQSTLSFKHRVTKPGDGSAALKAAKSKLNQPAEEIITSEIVKQSTPEPEHEEGATTKSSGKGKVESQESPVRILPSPSRRRKVRRSLHDHEEEDEVSFEAAEQQASKVSEAQVKKYWKAEEDSRIAPRVHQHDVHLHEKILRHFDLCSEYGPCIGITRLNRWKRAQGMNLNPPIEVLAVLLKEDAKDGKKGEKRTAGRLAYVDELGGGKEAD